MGKYRKLISEGLEDTINSIFPFEKDETKSFGIVLQPKALNRIVKMAFLMLFLTFNIGTALTLGFNDKILVPTGLNANRFALVVFIGSYAYFKYSDKIYEEAYRTAYEMDVVDREDTDVLNKVDPSREEKVMNVVDDVCDDAVGQAEDTVTRTTIEEVRRRIKRHFEGDNYVKQH